MSGDCCVALPCGAMGLYEVCDCGISLSYSLTIFTTLSIFIFYILNKMVNLNL